MYYHFLGGIIIEANFDLILSSDDECSEIIILFLVSAQYLFIYTQFTQKQKNRTMKHCPDSASNIILGISYTYLLHT